MMDDVTLKRAAVEANRFLTAVANFEEERRGNEMIYFGSKEGGALRRASMDLTRALADLRR